jgi:type II secretory pathway pseudopilin PulG
VRRRRHRKEHGFGLIEAVVAVGIVGASLVTLIGALGTAEKNAGLQSQQAHLEVALRTLGDELRNGVSYNRCTSNGGAYRNQLNQAPWSVPGVTVTSVTVARPSVPNSGPQLISNPCSNGRQDYGLQRLTIAASEGAASGSIVVLKSEATTAPLATPTPTPTP